MGELKACPFCGGEAVAQADGDIWHHGGSPCPLPPEFFCLPETWQTRAPDSTKKALAEAAKAFEELNVCYRLNKRPSEKLFDRLERAREALRLYESEGDG